MQRLGRIGILERSVLSETGEGPGHELFLPVVVGIHVGEETVVHAAPAASGQPVVLRDESGANQCCL